MLQIFVNGTEIDYSEEISISLKLISPMFKYDTIQGSYSMPFTLPATPKNNRVFDFPHKLTKYSHIPVKLPCKISHSGVQNMIIGIISAKKTSETKIDCDLRVDNGAFADEVGDKLLQEFDYGGAQEFQTIAPYAPDIVDYAAFTVKDEDFFKGTDWDNTERYGEAVANTAILALIPESSISDGEMRQVTDERIAYIYNATATSGYLLPFDDIDGIGYWDPIPNSWLTNPIINDTNLTGNINPALGKVIIPFPFLHKVIRYIFSSLGYALTDYVFSTMPLKYLTIFNLNDATVFPSSENGNSFLVPEYPFNINLKNHLPDISIKVFIKELQNLFNVIFLIKNGRCTIHKIDDAVISTSYVDISIKASDFYTKNLNFTKTGASIKWKLDENDEIMKNALLIDSAKHYYYFDIAPIGGVPGSEDGDVMIVTPTGGQEYIRLISLKIRTYNPPNWVYSQFENLYNGEGFLSPHELSLFQNYHETGREFVVDTNLSTLSDWTSSSNVFEPKCKQTGNSVINQDKIVKNSFRLLFYKGDETDGIGIFAKGGRYSKDSDLYLGWYGNEGIIYNYWRHTIEYMKNIEYYIDREILFTASEIKNFDFMKKYKIGSEIFFIDEISLSLKKDRISISNCKLLPDTKE